MTRWRLETTTEFDRAARKLDKPVVKRIRAYLEELLGLEAAAAARLPPTTTRRHQT